MRNKKIGKKRSEAFFIITNLILSIVAVAFLIGLEARVVSGDGEYDGRVNPDTGVGAPATTPTLAGGAGAVSWGKVFGLEPVGIPKATGGVSPSTAAFAQPFVQAFVWALYVYGAVQIVGSIFGLPKEQVNAVAQAAALGMLAGRGSFLLFGKGGLLTQGVWSKGIFQFMGAHPVIVGIAVAVIVFIATYKDVSYKVVSFNCMPWEAPRGGANCEKCNVEDKECSEYRCKSLGQSCQLTPGEKGMCTWVNRNDVTSPIITPLKSALSKGYDYKPMTPRPPGGGTEVIKIGGKCIEAFTPIQFGINTNEPTQCKIDYNHTKTYDEMQYYFGETNLYDYNHTQKLNLPSPDAINGSLQIKNDGIYTLYVRCMDANGNSNDDEYAIRFCVEPGPDTAPPSIEETSILDGMPVSYGADKVDIIVYTNEPADCKWSRENQNYENMENSMTCATQIYEIEANLLYACSSTLTGIKDREDNEYYFRCMDQPWLTGEQEKDRNVMTQSKKLTLKGTQPLNIIRVEPNGTITGSTSVINVTLEVETDDGYKEGEANCFYSPTENEKDYNLFFETNSYLHKQRQDLTAGEYTYYFKCVDLGGNAAYSKTSFTIEVDTAPPAIVRAYHDRDSLKIITNKDALCVYSTVSSSVCNYDFKDGIEMIHESSSRLTEHSVEWQTDRTYYIKCKDKNGQQPSPNDCSIIIRPSSLI